MSMSSDKIIYTALAMLRHLDKKNIIPLRGIFFNYSEALDDKIAKLRSELIDTYYNKGIIDGIREDRSINISEGNAQRVDFYNKTVKEDNMKSKLEEMALVIEAKYIDSDIELYKITSDINEAAKSSDLVKDYINITGISKYINDTLAHSSNDVKSNNDHVRYQNCNIKYTQSVLYLQALNLKSILAEKGIVTDILTVLDYYILIVNNVPDIQDMAGKNTNKYLKEWLQNDARFKID